MKNTITAIAIGVSTLLATPAFGAASHCATQGAYLPPAEQVAFMKSCLAAASSPANVQVAALQQKKAYCDKNVKNKALQGNDKESYLAACMDHNEAQAQYASFNRGEASANANIASVDLDRAVQKLTGFVTALLRTNPAGTQ